MMKPIFLSVDRIKRIHLDQVERYGGEPSIRDQGLLESAVAMPAESFGDQFLHAFPHEMAAAYLFHLVSNHAFVDGNKRVGLATALTFLKVSGKRLECEHQALEDLVLGVARGENEKLDVAIFFRDHLI